MSRSDISQTTRRWWWCGEPSQEMLRSRTRRWQTAVFASERNGDCEIEVCPSEAVADWRCCDLHSPFKRLSVQTALLQEAGEREDLSAGVFDPWDLLADGWESCGLPLPVETMILLQRRSSKRVVVVPSSLVRSGGDGGAAVVVLHHRIVGAFRGGRSARRRGRRRAEGLAEGSWSFSFLVDGEVVVVVVVVGSSSMTIHAFP